MAEDWEVNYPPSRPGPGLGTVITVSFLVSVIGAGAVQLAMHLLKPDRAVDAVAVAAQATTAPVKVPDMRGLSVAAARQQAADLGLRFYLSGPAPEDHIEESRVLGQAPLPGSLVRTGDVIEVQLSAVSDVSAAPAGTTALEEAAAEARKLVSVPNVVGATIAKASQQLTSLGLTVGTVQQQESADHPVGTVLSQGTAPGTEIGQGIPVALTVAAAPAKTLVPKVAGDAAHARRVLKDAGLKARLREVFHPSISTGYVIRLKPAAGTEVEPGSVVDVYIAE